MRFVVLSTLAILGTFALSGCDKLGLGKKGDDGGTSSSGIGLSFLGGGDFEGEITMNMTNAKTKKPPTPVTFGIKKPKYRIDTSGPVGDNPQLAGGGSVILDPPIKKGYMLVHPQKMAIVLDFEKMKSMKTPGGMPGSRPGAPSAPSAPPKIDKTGKKEVIAGYTCEIWIITSEKSKADVCVAEGITWIDLTDLGWASPEVAAASALSGANHFPLRVISYDAKNVEEFRMEATKVEKKKLEDSRFVVPADYRQVDMGQMMGGMVPGGMPMPPNGQPPPKFPR